MADRLARVYGTEEDRVNCPFYYKIGACRHGDRCSRAHNRPTYSPCLLMQNMYQNPTHLYGPDGQLLPGVDARDVRHHFEDFYEDVWVELAEFGELEDMIISDNLGDHLLGNVYVCFREVDAAQKARTALHGRFYAGRPLLPEFSPVTDFREARCRQYDEANCNRGGHCNFLHIKPVGRSLMRDLHEDQHRKHQERSRRRSRSRSRSRDREQRKEREEVAAKRGSSAERRDMIAKWAKEGGDEGGGAATAAGGGGGGGGGADAPK